MITKVNNEVLAGSETTIEKFVTTVRENPNKQLMLEIIRDSESKSPKTLSVGVVPTLNTQGRVSVGLGINARVKEVVNTKAANLIDGITIGVQETGRLIVFTWNGLLKAVNTG